jgi:hypothetical protein
MVATKEGSLALGKTVARAVAKMESCAWRCVVVSGA